MLLRYKVYRSFPFMEMLGNFSEGVASLLVTFHYPINSFRAYWQHLGERILCMNKCNFS